MSNVYSSATFDHQDSSAERNVSRFVAFGLRALGYVAVAAILFPLIPLWGLCWVCKYVNEKLVAQTESTLL